MAEDEILAAWQKAIKPGEKVCHSANWKEVGEYLGPSSHPEYDAAVNWPGDPLNPCPCYLRNLRPAWWPKPAWVESQNR